MFLKLPFGLTTAPWAFSRLMRPIKKFLRLHDIHISSFLDDFLIAAHQRFLCSLHTTWTADLLEWLGFQINDEKSERAPRQTIIYLGVLLNPRDRTLALPPDDVTSVIAQCKRVIKSCRVTRRQLVISGSTNFCERGSYGESLNWRNGEIVAGKPKHTRLVTLSGATARHREPPLIAAIILFQ